MTQDQEENFQKKFLRILENRDSRRSLPTAAIVPVLAIESSTLGWLGTLIVDPSMIG